MEKTVIKEIKKIRDCTEEEAHGIWADVENALIAAIQKDEHLTLRGFGSFITSQRNPTTVIFRGAEYDVPGHKVVDFRAGKKLKAAVNRADEEE